MGELLNNEKYRALLETGKHLFWKFGIKRVTIEEICKESKVSKMTFYRFFPNKEALVKTILQHIFDKGVKEYRAIMSLDIPFEDKIKMQIQKKLEGIEEISAEFIKDIYGNSESDIINYWKSRKDEMLNMVLNDYELAQKNGLIRNNIKREFIILFYAKMIEMVNDPQLQTLYGSMQDLIMEITNMYFYGILPHEEKK